MNRESSPANFSLPIQNHHNENSAYCALPTAAVAARLNLLPGEISCLPVDISIENQIAIFLMRLDLVTLERISTDKETPTNVLETLAHHPNTDVRAVVAENANTPSVVLQKLAGDMDPNVRFQLAENPNLPIELIHFLANDENPYVACRAQRTLLRVACS